MKIFEEVKKSKEYLSLKDTLCRKNEKISLSGLVPSYAANLICTVMSDLSQKAVYIAGNALSAAKIAEDFRFFSEETGEKVLLLNPYEYMLYDVEAKSSELSAARVELLYKILRGDWQIVVTTPAAVAQWLPNPFFIQESALFLRQGDVMELENLIQKLIKIRYTRLPQIDGKGQFAVRGDIVDIYPYTSENPIRIEFFDNEIDSVRLFDIFSQRTIET